MNYSMFFQNFVILVAIIMFITVPITNVALFIAYRVIKKKWDFKHLRIPIGLCVIEVVLFSIMFIAPIRDGGVFLQALWAEIFGVGAIVTQIFYLNEAREAIKNLEAEG